jgi:hypothetical protein
MQLANPASTFVQLIFAGGKTSLNGTDLNPYIAQQVNGSQVAVGPLAVHERWHRVDSGSCVIADMVYDTVEPGGSMLHQVQRYVRQARPQLLELDHLPLPVSNKRDVRIP